MLNYKNINFEPLAAYLESLIEFGFPSYDCMVFQNHECIFSKKNGFSDIKNKIPISDSSLYYFYSLTKLLTSVSALQLVENGSLKLDDYVYKYIPSFKNQKIKINGNLIESTKQIKIINLLTMTSGVGYGYWDRTIKSYLKETGDSNTVNVVSAFGKSTLEFVPGEKWCYGFSMDIIAAIIEIVSGLSFPLYVKKYIFDPLEMNDSAFRIYDKTRLATLYEFDDEEKYLLDFDGIEFELGADYYSGGGGLISTTYDYAVFADALACDGESKNGYHLLKPESVKEMNKNHLDQNTLCYFRKFGDGQYIPYGYGFGVRTRMNKDNTSFGPIGEFGWGGASGSLVFIDPTRHLSLIYSQHCLNNHEERVLPRLRDSFFYSIECYENLNR